jgi:hypothetical protein
VVVFVTNDMGIETLALYSLRKYRHLKNAYYSEENTKTRNVPTLDHISKDLEKE